MRRYCAYNERGKHRWHWLSFSILFSTDTKSVAFHIVNAQCYLTGVYLKNEEFYRLVQYIVEENN